MELKDNPFILPFNYTKDYHVAQPDEKSEKKHVDFEKLCFELFEANPKGKKLQAIIKSRFLMAPAPGQIGKNYEQSCIYYEGFKEAYRYLLNCVESYKQRKQYETLSANLKSGDNE